MEDNVALQKMNIYCYSLLGFDTEALKEAYSGIVIPTEPDKYGNIRYYFTDSEVPVYDTIQSYPVRVHYYSIYQNSINSSGWGIKTVLFQD